jgi:hypothetical protein
MMQDEAEGEDRLRAANGRLMAEIERLRAALREIAAVEPQSWTTLRARAALEQQAPADAKEKDDEDWDHRTVGKASFFNPRN